LPPKNRRDESKCNIYLTWKTIREKS